MFGTIYDISTVMILGFAGVSAMAGLLNLVPQYLPRYGMAPEWARAVRPLVLLFTVDQFAGHLDLRRRRRGQGGAYATGVLVLISSACVATVIDHWRERHGHWYRRLSWRYVLITAIFFYTTAANMVERPDGIKIASWFIIAIVVSSFWSRLQRSTELRFKAFEFVDLRIQVSCGTASSIWSFRCWCRTGPAAADWTRRKPASASGTAWPPTCRSCSSKPSWAIPANSSTAR